MAISTAMRPTRRLMRPPYRTRGSRSRPWASVPNGREPRVRARASRSFWLSSSVDGMVRVRRLLLRGAPGRRTGAKTAQDEQDDEAEDDEAGRVAQEAPSGITAERTP